MANFSTGLVIDISVIFLSPTFSISTFGATESVAGLVNEFSIIGPLSVLCVSADGAAESVVAAGLGNDISVPATFSAIFSGAAFGIKENAGKVVDSSTVESSILSPCCTCSPTLLK